MMKFLPRLALLLAPVALISACGLSDADRATLTATSQNAQAAKDAADRAAASAQQADAAMQSSAQAAQQMQAAQSQMYERGLRK